MGKANQGVFGAWTKKVGNVVGRVRQGVNIYSIYQPNVANPNTTAQKTTRNQFSAVAKLASIILGFLQVGFKNLDGYRYGSAFSSAVGYNLKRGVASYNTGTGVTTMDYSKLVVSEGNIVGGFSMNASTSGGDVALSWADNTGHGDALATDQVMILAFNEQKSECAYTTAGAARSTRAATLTLPAHWSGDNVEVYSAFHRESTGECSMSEYLGSIQL